MSPTRASPRLEPYVEPPKRREDVTVPSCSPHQESLLHMPKVPILHWLREYKRTDLLWDLQAGLLVGTLLIPQGMAYGLLAGLPPIAGLYCAVVPNITYACLGTSRESAVAAMALVAMMVGNVVVSHAASTDVTGRMQVASQLALLTGLVQVVLGVLKLGEIACYVSHPVTIGFCTGGEILIAISQLKYLLGLKVPTFKYAYQTVAYIAVHIGESHGPTVGLGFSTVTLLYLLSRWRKRKRAYIEEHGGSPTLKTLVLLANLGGLVAILITTGLSYGMSQWGAPTAVIGHVPEGFQIISPTFYSMDSFQALLPQAVLLAVISFMLTFSVASKYALKAGYEVEPSQELIALGVGNSLGSFFGSFPIAGGFARTAVNVDAGARTQVSAIVSSAVIILAINVLTSTFYFIPMCTLASIVQVAIFGVIDPSQFVLAWKASRSEFGIMTVTLIITLALGVDKGIMVGVALSLMALVRRTSRPQLKVLGRIPGTAMFRDTHRYTNSRQLPGVRILRVDESLHFASCQAIKEQILDLALVPEQALDTAELSTSTIFEGGSSMTGPAVATVCGTTVVSNSKDDETRGLRAANGVRDMARGGPPPRNILLDFCGVNYMDLSGLRALEQTEGALRKRGQDLFVGNVKARIRDKLKGTSGLWDKLGGDRIYLSLPAFVALLTDDQAQADELMDHKHQHGAPFMDSDDQLEWYI